MSNNVLTIDVYGASIENDAYKIVVAGPLVEGEVGIKDFNKGNVYAADGEFLMSFDNAATFIEAAELLKDVLWMQYGGYK